MKSKNKTAFFSFSSLTGTCFRQRYLSRNIKCITILAILGIFTTLLQGACFAIDSLDLQPITRVAIDPGFGGKDPGPQSCVDGIYAKDINLEISKLLAQKIEAELKLEAILTRSTDIFVPLEQRTTIANVKQADVFISIHANGSKSPHHSGIQTFYFEKKSDARDIQYGEKPSQGQEQLQLTLGNLIQEDFNSKSISLASCLQKSIFKRISKTYPGFKDRGIKKDQLAVLTGAQMPAVLIETSFITNPTECQRLITKSYQEDICNGIIDGLKNFIELLKAD